MSPQELTSLIQAAFPGALVEVQDYTGSGDHFQALVVSEAFVGLSRVKQHQRVYAALQSYLDDGRIHALALKTYTPEQWQQSLVQLG
ncbi:MAG: BolA/IbaG family iron-sulfur metabolism protein [Thermostichales cyanobacterium SZTDM-1c_bins_54]